MTYYVMLSDLFAARIIMMRIAGHRDGPADSEPALAHRRVTVKASRYQCQCPGNTGGTVILARGILVLTRAGGHY